MNKNLLEYFIQTELMKMQPSNETTQQQNKVEPIKE